MTSPLFVHSPPAMFRGTRDYVHSTDLYDEVVAGAVKAGFEFDGPIDFRIKSKIIRKPVYTYLPASEMIGHIAASCLFTSGEVPIVAAITEEGELVAGSKHYDESPAVKSSKIIGCKAVLSKDTGMRPIETVTALAVHLHKTTCPPPPNQRWMLGQLSLRRPFCNADSQDLILQIDKIIGGSVTRTAILGHDGHLGTMVFVLKASSL